MGKASSVIETDMLPTLGIYVHRKNGNGIENDYNGISNHGFFNCLLLEKYIWKQRTWFGLQYEGFTKNSVSWYILILDIVVYTSDVTYKKVWIWNDVRTYVAHVDWRYLFVNGTKRMEVQPPTEMLDPQRCRIHIRNIRCTQVDYIYINWPKYGDRMGL